MTADFFQLIGSLFRILKELFKVIPWRNPTKRNWIPKFYRQCKLAGPNKEKLDSQFLQTMQVGVGRRNKFCENIISVPLHWHLRSLNVQLEYMYNNIKHAVKRSQSIQTDFAHRVFLT